MKKANSTTFKILGGAVAVGGLVWLDALKIIGEALLALSRLLNGQ